MQQPVIAILICLLSAFGCSIADLEGDIPAYVQINEFELEAGPGQGSASSKITDAWVFVEGGFLGVYDLPADVPILAEAPREVCVQPGINENGISSTPQIYPFYKQRCQVIDLQPNTDVAILAQTTYLEETRFGFIEDFEGSGNIFQDLIVGSNLNRIQNSPEEPFEGRNSGKLRLDSVAFFAELATTIRFKDLLERGNSVFLELNYKSEAPVIFGTIGHFNNALQDPVTLYVAGFNPSASWNKIYFNLTPAVQELRADEYQIVLQTSLLTENGTFSGTKADVYLDNVKLVYF